VPVADLPVLREADAQEHDRAREVQHVVGTVEGEDVRVAVEQEQPHHADEQVDGADQRVRGLPGATARLAASSPRPIARWTMLCSGLTAKPSSESPSVPAKPEKPVTAKPRAPTSR
jgi:hypothetical protein